MFGFIPAAIGGIASFIGGCVSTIASVATTIGSTIASVATSILTKLPSLEIFQVIIDVVKFIADILGVTKQEDKVDEMGWKAMNSEKKLEDFDSTQDYIDHLRNDVKLDIEKFNKISDFEKAACSAIGVSIFSKGIEEKKEMTISPDFWIEIAKQGFSNDVTLKYLDYFKENNVEPKLHEYLSGELTIAEKNEVRPVIEKVIAETNSGISNDEIDNKIMEMKEISSK